MKIFCFVGHVNLSLVIFLSRCAKRIRKTRKNSLFDEDEDFKASIERFLNDCDMSLNWLGKRKVVEEIALVATIDPKANHENVEFIISNDL